MLKSMRDGAKKGVLKFILMGLLLLAGGGLILTDVGGFFRSGGVSNNLVAKGKNIEISTVHFDSVLRRILAAQGMNAQEAYNLGLVNQVLNNEIQTMLLMREAQSLGIRVDDETVLAQISKIAEPLAQSGRTKAEAIRQILRSQGVSEGEFIQAIRQEMSGSLFQSAVDGTGLSISYNQAQDLYKYREEGRVFKAITLQDTDAKIEKLSTDEILQKFYETKKADFAISEKRSITIATLKPESIESNLVISDEELQAYYKDNENRFKKPENRLVEQSILSQQSEAENIIKAIKEGSSLKEAVIKLTGGEKPYLGENKFEREGLMKDVAVPVFAAKKDDVVGPIQTPLGWHVLVVKDIYEPATIPFDAVKKDLKEQVRQEKLSQEIIDAANLFDDRLASGESLETLVKDLNLTIENFSNFNQAGLDNKGKDLFAAYQGDRAVILQNAFDYDISEIAPVVELADGRFIAVRVDSIEEKKYKPYTEVKERLKQQWMEEQKKQVTQDTANKILADLSSGKSLEDVAKEYNEVIKTYSGLKRATTPASPLNLPALREIFSTEKDKIIKLNVDTGILIGAVSSINLPDTSKSDSEIKAIQKETQQLLSQEFYAQYINYLSAKYDVKINDRILKQLYGTVAE